MAGAHGAPEPEAVADAEGSLRYALHRWTKALARSLDPADRSVQKKIKVTGEEGIVVEAEARPAGSVKLENPQKKRSGKK